MSDIDIQVPPWMILLFLGYHFWYYTVIAILVVATVGFLFRGWVRILSFTAAGLLALALLGDAIFWWTAPD